MKPTLFILAAGMGTRYGGLKQLEGLGPNGETLIDYSIYDAIKTGFGKVVIVIRKSFEKEFIENIVKKYEKLIPIELIFQAIDKVPDSIKVNPVRHKPWGTGHALLMAKGVINEPFGVINADDFYGRESFQLLAGQLSSMTEDKHNYRMIGYRLGNTLAESGAVARAICEVDEDSFLTKIVERNEIERIDGVPSYKDEDGNWINLTDTTRISMNMWGFTPDIFPLLEKYVTLFLEENKDCLDAECPLPTFINHIISEKEASVKLINTPAKWFGVTYITDKPEVAHKIKELVEDDVYPYNLY